MKLQELLEMLLIRRVGICILDAHTLICQTVNDSFLEIAGKPREVKLNHYYWYSFREVAHEYKPALADVVLTGQPFLCQ